jgi:hypothetical protein
VVDGGEDSFLEPLKHALNSAAVVFDADTGDFEYEPKVGHCSAGFWRKVCRK